MKARRRVKSSREKRSRDKGERGGDNNLGFWGEWEMRENGREKKVWDNGKIEWNGNLIISVWHLSCKKRFANVLIVTFVNYQVVHNVE